MARKFYRTIFQYEVLSERPCTNMTIKEAIEECFDGEFSGRELDSKEEIIDGPACAKALQEQGSDPEFFQLDENGNDIEV